MTKTTLSSLNAAANRLCFICGEPRGTRKKCVRLCGCIPGSHSANHDWKGTRYMLWQPEQLARIRWLVQHPRAVSG